MKVRRWVFYWLAFGVVLVYCQIIIGGVTRLTGSGLSITKWEIVTGTLPPMSDTDWQNEFKEYQDTPQYEKLNQGMSLSEFKFIYFWEYFHRLWARFMGIAFIIPFLWFYRKGFLPSETKKDLLVVVLLAATAASFGWIMVASGLINRPWVNAYKLSLHLLLGISVFSYLLWTTLKYRYGAQAKKHIEGRKFFMVLSVLLILQLIFGGWMSGMKAALFYPTWPSIGGYIVPPDVFNSMNWKLAAFMDYEKSGFVPGVVQLIHRTVAYLLVILVALYGWKRDLWRKNGLSTKTYRAISLVIVVQVVIGVVTLIKSIGMVPVFWGVLHQGVAVILVAAFVVHYYFRYFLRREER